MIVQVDYEACSNLVLKLAQMQEQGKYCDFSIFVFGHEIKAHKCVLAACCEYFQTSFNFDQSSEPVSMDLSHMACEPKYVEMVIRSFYTNEIDLDTSCLDSVLKLVDYFMCDSLRRCVETFMLNSLNFYTAVTYFQLSVQYNLNSKKLLSSTKWLLWYRFHDYFIYQPELLDSSVEVVEALLTYNILHHSNPLLVLDFFLKNVQANLTRLLELNLQEGLKREIQYKLSHSFHSVKFWLHSLPGDTLDKWRDLLLDSVQAWANTCESRSLQAMNCLVTWLERRLQVFMGKNSLVCADEECCICHHDTNCGRLSCKTSLTDDNANCASEDQLIITTGTSCPIQDIADISCPLQHVTDTLGPVQDVTDTLGPVQDMNDNHGSVQNVNDSVDLHRSNTTVESLNTDHCKITQQNSPAISQSLDKVIVSIELTSQIQQSEVLVSTELLPHDSRSDCLSNIIVVLAPSGEMASQIMAIEAEKGNCRPLLKSPQLDLAFYDTEMKTWRQGCQVYFPIPGVMLEKHAWRMAFLADSLYLFSANKGLALEFNLTKRLWAHLDGEQLFMKHRNNSPVKSVIPIAVGSRLIVLSMSREAKTCGTFQTMQHFYEMNLKSKTFTLTASVQNDHLDQPITKWTVNGNILITVKASTMMHRKFISIQYIHIYNAETRSLQIIEVDCAIESGINILTKGNILYLLDKEGWCRSYDLETATWLTLSRHPAYKITGSLNALYAEDVYPALTRVTCQAGSSRWEITTSNTAVNSSTKETFVDEDNQLKTSFHPSPPFQFMTAMCPGQMTRSNLDQLGFPVFNFVDNRMLNFTITNSVY